MNIIWYNIKAFNLLWLLPMLVILFAWNERHRRKTLERLLTPNLRNSLVASLNPTRRYLKFSLLLLGIASLILTIARPAWNPIPQQVRRQGRDVVFLLDVSRSMLAQDLKPNRLERAKISIEDCLDALEGDRIALVIFAGSAVVKCPLTLDYGFFRMMLNDVTTDSVTRGGTMTGDALRKVAKEVFDQQQKLYKDIVLITDGEDQGSFPVEAAEAIGAEGIRLLAIGLGADGNGAPIIIKDENGRDSILTYQGETVRSKLDSETLRQMVNATPGGRFLPVGTGNVDLGQVYRDLIATAEKHDLEEETLMRYEEKFQVFLLFAMFCFAFSSCLNERRKAAQTAVSKTAAKLSVLVLLCLAAVTTRAADLEPVTTPQTTATPDASTATTPALSPYQNYNQGLEAFQNGDFTAAEQFFQAAADQCAILQPPNRELEARCHLALGNAVFRKTTQPQENPQDNPLEGLNRAIQSYQRASDLQPELEVASHNRDVARLLQKRLLKQLEDQQKQKQQQSDKLQELADKQEEAAQDSQQAGNASKNDSNKQQQMQENQQKLQDETQQLAQDTASSGANDKVQEKLEQAQQKQQAAQQSLQQGDNKQAAQHQQEAAQALRQAKEEFDQQNQPKDQSPENSNASNEQNDSKSPQDSQDSQGEQKPNQENPTTAEQQQDAAQDSQDQNTQQTDSQFQLNDDAQDILDEEKRNLRLRQRRLAPVKDVDKNW